MTLNEKECKHIMRPTIKSGITKDEIHITLNTEVRYWPRSLGSVGIFYPFVIQGAGRIDFLIEHY